MRSIVQFLVVLLLVAVGSACAPVQVRPDCLPGPPPVPPSMPAAGIVTDDGTPYIGFDLETAGKIQEFLDASEKWKAEAVSRCGPVQPLRPIQRSAE